MPKKQLFTLEYPVRCSPNILYGFLSTPAGLGEWFADKVDERDKVFIFWWNSVIEKAELIDSEIYWYDLNWDESSWTLPLIYLVYKNYTLLPV